MVYLGSFFMVLKHRPRFLPIQAISTYSAYVSLSLCVLLHYHSLCLAFNQCPLKIRKEPVLNEYLLCNYECILIQHRSKTVSIQIGSLTKVL